MFKEISQLEAKKIMDTENDFVCLDVRTKEEFEEKHIYNATLIPLNELDEKIEEIIPDKGKKILVYCRSGVRSKEACKILSKKGYTNLLEFGGIVDWIFDVVQ